MIKCPRCLYDKLVWKVKQPSGPFPSLPGGVDNAMKNYCDRFRGALPPILKALIPQVPELEEFVLHQDIRWMNGLRDWKGGLIYTLKIDDQVYKISGAIDDLFVRTSDGAIAIVDGKSKAKKPEPGEGAKYYGAQMDAYDLIFSRSGFPTCKTAFLWYVTPVSFTDGDLAVPSAAMYFDNTVQKLEADGDRALALIHEVHKIIMDHPDRSNPPKSGMSCDFCNWAGRT
jgi:hypothetical protein